MSNVLANSSSDLDLRYESAHRGRSLLSVPYQTIGNPLSAQSQHSLGAGIATSVWIDTSLLLPSGIITRLGTYIASVHPLRFQVWRPDAALTAAAAYKLTGEYLFNPTQAGLVQVRCLT